MRTLLAHTADLRAELEAPDLAGLYAEAGALLRETLVGESAVEPRAERRLPLAGENDAERFFRFVRELVFLYDAEGFLPARVRLEGAAARVAGERFDPERHTSERQIKALTRHRYRLQRTAAGVRAELVFDL